jgi:iron(III) transport system substrate-binding protein
MRRYLSIFLLLALVVAAPILMRRQSAVAESGQSDDRLVIITPHNETIRAEFGEAFARHWREKTGRSIYIDWRTPGGTSEIRRVIDGAYKATPEGIGIDVFFGGGDYEFNLQSKGGHLAPLEVFTKHPEWFQDSVIPQHFTGETYYPSDHLWVGCCLSQFGMAYNLDSIQRLGCPEPKHWEDLANPAYTGYLALADPTKSASVGRAFEMIVQEQMQKVIREKGDTPTTREEGWKNGINMLQRLAANARYFTDSASKIPHDVSQGDAAAGTCIDFYGRSFEENLKEANGTSRLRWTSPEGGTSVSVDPIAVMKGAPHMEIAQEFIAFCLSPQAQLLWNLKPGTPGGPQERSPRRMPIRRDVYTPENLVNFSDPDALPYERTGGFAYKPELTQKAAKALAMIFRAMAIDSHEEMKSAWRALHSGKVSDPTAEAVFYDVGRVSYSRVMSDIVPLLDRKDPLLAAREASDISQTFRQNYEKAAQLASPPRP